MTHSRELSKFVRFLLGFAKEVNTASQGGTSFIYIVVGAAILCIPIGVGICCVYCREKNKQRITPVKKESSCPVKKESS